MTDIIITLISHIMIGVTLGGILKEAVMNKRYHLVRRHKDKEKDAELQEEVKSINERIFEFENVIKP